MAVRKRSIPRILLEQTLQYLGDTPDLLVIRNQKTLENQQQKGREEAKADLEERARTLVEKELNALTFFEKGELAVYQIYVCKDNRADVARALYLPPDTSALRVTMLRALRKYPCGKTASRCENVPGCAHRRGHELWRAIVRRVISQLQV
jgi:hypothetical protein